MAKTIDKNKPAKAVKRGKGHPSPYYDIDLEQIKKLYIHGLIDSQVADIFGVTLQTITNWKNAHPDFFATIKEAKEIADNEVIKSLRKRAMGYINADGKDIPPDTTA